MFRTREEADTCQRRSRSVNQVPFTRFTRAREATRLHLVQATEHTISKRNSMECASRFSDAVLLMPELAEPRNMLLRIVAKFVQQEVVEAGRVLFGEVRVKSEITTVTGELVQPIMERKTAFIYGRDPQTIRLVIQDVFTTVLTSSNVEVLTLDGTTLGTVSELGLREILYRELSRLRSPQSIILLLEEFSYDMFVNFQRCGFVHDNRMRGIRINTVRWSSKYIDRPSENRCFDDVIFVPEKRAELEVRPNTDPAPSTSDSNMIVHKTLGDKHSAGSTPRRNDSIRKHSAENLFGYYAELQQSAANGAPQSGAGDSSSEHATVKDPHNNYTDMQPVKKNTHMEHGTGPEKIYPHVEWSKKSAEAVKIENLPEDQRDDEDDRVGKKRTGCCTKFTNCIIGLYAWLLD